MSKSCFLCCIAPKSAKTDSLALRGDSTPDTVELATHLTAHDRKLIKETADIIFSQMHLENKGVIFLIAFFKKYPHHQKYFKMFRGIPPDELKSIPQTENHGRRVMNQMALIVQHLEEPEVIRQQLYELINKHSPRNVKPRQMKDMLNMFIVFTSQQLGSKFTAQHEAAWKKMTTHILTVLEEAGRQQTIGRHAPMDNGMVALDYEGSAVDYEETEIIKQGSDENVSNSGVDQCAYPRPDCDTSQ
ncbi:hypothetical protein BsWGS_13465 [Bradybaena similaris]